MFEEITKNLRYPYARVSSKSQEKLFQKQVTFISLYLPYSTDMAVTKLIATNLTAIATVVKNDSDKEFKLLRKMENILVKEPILVNCKNQFKVCFVVDNPYWGGTLLHFSGTNAARFYFFFEITNN